MTPTKQIEAIGRITVSWSPHRASCFFILHSSQASTPAAIQVQSDDTFDRPVRHGFAALANRDEISLAELQALFPEKGMMFWADPVVVNLGAIELRGKGGGLFFWISTPNPMGFDTPKPEQTASAHEHLTAVRDLVWPESR